MNQEYGLIFSLFLLAAFNLYASYRCIRSDYSHRAQKIIQCILVWLFPLVGGLVIIHFSEPMDTSPNYKSPDVAPSQDAYPTSNGGIGGD